MKHYAYKFINKGNIAIYEFIPSYKDEYTYYADSYKVYQTNDKKATYADLKHLEVNQEIAFSLGSVYKSKKELMSALINQCEMKLSIIESGL